MLQLVDAAPAADAEELVDEDRDRLGMVDAGLVVLVEQRPGDLQRGAAAGRIGRIDRDEVADLIRDLGARD